MPKKVPTNIQGANDIVSFLVFFLLSNSATATKNDTSILKKQDIGIPFMP